MQGDEREGQPAPELALDAGGEVEVPGQEVEAAVGEEHDGRHGDVGPVDVFVEVDGRVVVEGDVRRRGG